MQKIIELTMLSTCCRKETIAKQQYVDEPLWCPLLLALTTRTGEMGGWVLVSDARNTQLLAISDIDTSPSISPCLTQLFRGAPQNSTSST